MVFLIPEYRHFREVVDIRISYSSAGKPFYKTLLDIVISSFDGQWIFLEIMGVFENAVTFKILEVFEILIV